MSTEFNRSVSCIFQGKRRHRRARWSKPSKSRKTEVAVGGDTVCESKSERDDKSELDSQHSEEAPPEDACKHCGLPNHPELVGHVPVSFLINIFTE